ncbi:toxic anion resistance protein [Butyrivibrio sp. AE3004]|uniref:toxic anion resistance protein n=1 Tax=Butyrivibrio sp. AE3004 TaxID=1506994 RepID=UPI0004942136|nr:toxic anion resistance protein [Butyrivibrio sp. AE3004]
MGDEFKEFENAAPTLSFDMPADEGTGAAAAAVQEAPQAEQVQPKETQLTEEEMKQVDAFVQQIDITNSQGVMNYGAGTQKKMADFSEKAIDNVRTKDMGEVGNMIAGLVTELKNFEVDEDEKGIMSFFKKSTNKVTALKARYTNVEKNVETISNELERHQVQLMKDVATLDNMYKLNLNYYKELSMYIIAGKKKLEQVRANELVEAQKKAEQSGLPEDAQAAKDLASLCDRFEKKIYDLELTRTIAMQTGPQIRMVQSADTAMAEKIQSTIVNTIPLWKNQMVIAIGIEHSAQAAKAEREVNDMTNALLRKNADMLKVASVEAAKESERGIVDMETLKHTNETLISTLDEVMKIQTEGKEKRKNAEAELEQIEGQLREKLLQAAKN